MTFVDDMILRNNFSLAEQLRATRLPILIYTSWSEYETTPLGARPYVTASMYCITGLECYVVITNNVISENFKSSAHDHFKLCNEPVLDVKKRRLLFCATSKV